MSGEEVLRCPREDDDWVLRCSECGSEKFGKEYRKERELLDDEGHRCVEYGIWQKCSVCGSEMPLGGTLDHVGDELRLGRLSLVGRLRRLWRVFLVIGLLVVVNAWIWRLL